ncbi:serine/threonine protein kinase [Fodinibius salinus]|uniref:Serine/threonine protein kinase n=1 Tax=Fodinibius salinus TaxID=860790 RepID=A0A5D3YN62_9BACT|nr:serine/threonine-protein kinase [Fodinibius salinus]TYP95304.1 serine/threonine protein kinase [Fodinibius salinus]
MSDINWHKVETIVDQALELPEDKRKTFVQQKCKGNPKLKGEVTQLLESIFDSEGWLDNPAKYKNEFYSEVADNIESLSPDRSLIGQKVGGFTITKELGTGGMGSVYLAQRTEEEYDHQVAIKIIRDSRATPSNLQRFKREQKILAELNHPGIARFFDGGITENGTPYIIMEYVEGVPVDEYCKQNNCTIGQKINLFKQVLQAVRHAHENLVIHRDLKPGNILVDNNGTVKILDFGISKLLEDDEDLQLTQTGNRMLTPRYAAPEQIKETNITTATDLYTLGVILYELLTNSTPFDLENTSLHKIEKQILHKEPVSPSRTVNDKGIQKKLRGDLDAIILKAIRKEPGQRYRVANEFLEDLDRYQTGVPVSAREGSFRYRTYKFINRHKKGIVTAAGVLVFIIGLSGFYGWRITQERDQAQFEAKRAEEITNFLVSTLELNNPSENSGDDITINDALNRGIDYLQKQDMSALNRATILGTIGSIQIKNGDIDQAEKSLEKAITFVTDSLEKQTPKTLLIGSIYAEWNKLVGNMEKAEQYFQLSDSLYQKNNLQNSPSFLEHQLNYSDFLLEVGKYQKALTILSGLDNIFEKFEQDDESTVDFLADMYNNRGRAYKNLGKNQKALRNLEQALEIKRQIYDEDNPKIAKLYHNTGVVYATIADYPKAMEMAKKAYEIRLNVFNPTHRLVGSTLQLLGNIAIGLGNYDQAYNYIKESVTITKKQHGPNHFRYALALREYAKVFSQTGKFDSALQQIQKAEEIIKDNYSSGHPYYGFVMNTYGDIYYKTGNYDKAMTYGDKTIAVFSASLGPSHPNLGRAYANQGKYALHVQQLELADSLLTKSVSILEQHFDNSNPYLKEADSLLKISQKR